MVFGIGGNGNNVGRLACSRAVAINTPAKIAELHWVNSLNGTLYYYSNRCVGGVFNIYMTYHYSADGGIGNSGFGIGNAERTGLRN